MRWRGDGQEGGRGSTALRMFLQSLPCRRNHSTAPVRRAEVNRHRQQRTDRRGAAGRMVSWGPRDDGTHTQDRRGGREGATGGPRGGGRQRPRWASEWLMPGRVLETAAGALSRGTRAPKKGKKGGCKTDGRGTDKRDG